MQLRVHGLAHNRCSMNGVSYYFWLEIQRGMLTPRFLGFQVTGSGGYIDRPKKRSGSEIWWFFLALQDYHSLPLVPCWSIVLVTPVTGQSLTSAFPRDTAAQNETIHFSAQRPRKRPKLMPFSLQSWDLRGFQFHSYSTKTVLNGNKSISVVTVPGTE